MVKQNQLESAIKKAFELSGEPTGCNLDLLADDWAHEILYGLSDSPTPEEIKERALQEFIHSGYCRTAIMFLGLNLQ
jgi:hypothetical protein